MKVFVQPEQVNSCFYMSGAAGLHALEAKCLHPEEPTPVISDVRGFLSVFLFFLTMDSLLKRSIYALIYDFNPDSCSVWAEVICSVSEAVQVGESPVGPRGSFPRSDPRGNCWASALAFTWTFSSFAPLVRPARASPETWRCHQRLVG